MNILNCWYLKLFALFVCMEERQWVSAQHTVLLLHFWCHRFEISNGLLWHWEFCLKGLQLSRQQGWNDLCQMLRNELLEVPFLSIDCNGDLDIAQRRTSALQTSKCGQMVPLAVMCCIENQLLLCRSWNYVFRKSDSLLCILCFWHIRKWK